MDTITLTTFEKLMEWIIYNGWMFALVHVVLTVIIKPYGIWLYKQFEEWGSSVQGSYEGDFVYFMFHIILCIPVLNLGMLMLILMGKLISLSHKLFSKK